MNNYIKHLQELSVPQTLIRKKRYINYNLGSYFKKIGYKDIEALEIGPGLGEFEGYLNDIGIFDADIADNDEYVLDYVSKRYRIGIPFLTNNIAQIDKKLGKYNFILLMQVLEHMPVSEYSKALRILYNHLEKNGYLVVVVPNGNNPLGLIERYADLQHTGCFTEPSLRDLVGLTGIKNYQIEIKGYAIPPYDLINLIRIFLQKILHLILYLIMIINGGNYFKIMTPNIMLIIRRE